MKKKTVLFIVTLLTVSSIVSGCGKKNEQKEAEKYYQNELGLTKEEAKSLSEEIAHEQEINDKLEKEREEYKAEQEKLEKEKEDTLSEYKVYGRNPEWDNIRYDGTIQLDETIITPGMTVKEVLSRLDSSEVEYEYRYRTKNDEWEPINNDILNGNLTTENFAIFLYRDNIPWCNLIIRSCSTSVNENEVEPLPILDSYITGIYPKEEAIPYCRFFGGISPSEEITLDDLYWIKDVYFENIPDTQKKIYEKKDTISLKMDMMTISCYKIYSEMGWKVPPAESAYVYLIYNTTTNQFEKFSVKVM